MALPTRPLTVLHLETGQHLYGGALQVLYLMAGLHARGARNLLLCPASSRIAAAAAAVAEVLPLRYAGDLDPRLLRAILSTLRRKRPHLLHVHSRRGADWWGAAAAAWTGVPAVLSRRVDNPERSVLGRLKYRAFDRIVTISEGIRSVLRREGIEAARLACVPSGIPLDDRPGTCARGSFLTAFQLPPDALTVAVVAQLIPRKGHRFLIEAMPAILRHCPQARFLFFGQGPLEAALRSQCRQAGVLDRVRFAGFRTDLRQWLPCLDLVAHPATLEGLGIALLEAAAAERPIVAAAAGGIPEIVADGENGLLVPSSDSAALARAIGELLTDPQRRRRMGVCGRLRVRERFSTQAMVTGNLNVYSQVLTARGTAAQAAGLGGIAPEERLPAAARTEAQASVEQPARPAG